MFKARPVYVLVDPPSLESVLSIAQFGGEVWFEGLKSVFQGEDAANVATPRFGKVDPNLQDILCTQNEFDEISKGRKANAYILYSNDEDVSISNFPQNAENFIGALQCLNLEIIFLV